VKLFLYAIENKRCKVGAEEGTRAIGLPFDQVFYFDLDKFSALSTAFEQNDKANLSSEWQKMTVDDFACNKYRDVLRSLHDQESISSSGSAQECGGQ
jgi:hypothetical protein